MPLHTSSRKKKKGQARKANAAAVENDSLAVALEDDSILDALVAEEDEEVDYNLLIGELAHDFQSHSKKLGSLKASSFGSSHNVMLAESLLKDTFAGEEHRTAVLECVTAEIDEASPRAKYHKAVQDDLLFALQHYEKVMADEQFDINSYLTESGNKRESVGTEMQRLMPAHLKGALNIYPTPSVTRKAVNYARYPPMADAGKGKESFSADNEKNPCMRTDTVSILRRMYNDRYGESSTVTNFRDKVGVFDLYPYCLEKGTEAKLKRQIDTISEQHLGSNSASVSVINWTGTVKQAILNKRLGDGLLGVLYSSSYTCSNILGLEGFDKYQQVLESGLMTAAAKPHGQEFISKTIRSKKRYPPHIRNFINRNVSAIFNCIIGAEEDWVTKLVDIWGGGPLSKEEDLTVPLGLLGHVAKMMASNVIQWNPELLPQEYKVMFDDWVEERGENELIKLLKHLRDAHKTSSAVGKLARLIIEQGEGSVNLVAEAASLPIPVSVDKLKKRLDKQIIFQSAPKLAAAANRGGKDSIDLASKAISLGLREEDLRKKVKTQQDNQDSFTIARKFAARQQRGGEVFDVNNEEIRKASKELGIPPSDLINEINAFVNGNKKGGKAARNKDQLDLLEAGGKGKKTVHRASCNKCTNIGEETIKFVSSTKPNVRCHGDCPSNCHRDFTVSEEPLSPDECRRLHAEMEQSSTTQVMSISDESSSSVVDDNRESRVFTFAPLFSISSESVDPHAGMRVAMRFNNGNHYPGTIINVHPVHPIQPDVGLTVTIWLDDSTMETYVQYPSVDIRLMRNSSLSIAFDRKLFPLDIEE